LSRLGDPVGNLREYVAAARRIRRLLAPHVTALLRLGLSVVFDFGGNTVHDRNWVRAVFEEANAAHVLHYVRADDETCRSRVRQRNQVKPEGLFFGVVSDVQVEEVNRYFVPPDPNERFNVVTYDV
jgi:predicted kinase